MNLIKRFKSLSASSQRLLTIGVVMAFVVALPLSIVSFVNQKLIFTPRAENGPTNACGGTCGSIYNCDVNLYCYIANGETSGYCRNPDCPSSLTCGCPTPRPGSTPSPKTTVKATPTPTATTPTPTSTATPTESPMAISTTPIPVVEPPKTDFTSIAVWVAIGLIALITTLITINALRKKSPPKNTKPPVVPPKPLPENPSTQVPPPTGF